jgi:rRNA maturation protein Nop10
MSENRETSARMTVSALCPRCGVKQALVPAPGRCIECGTMLYWILPSKNDDRAVQPPK